MDIGYIPKDIGTKWVAETNEISAMLGGLIKARPGFLKNAVTFLFSFIL
jgi:hypothetical protein